MLPLTLMDTSIQCIMKILLGNLLSVASLHYCWLKCQDKLKHQVSSKSSEILKKEYVNSLSIFLQSFWYNKYTVGVIAICKCNFKISDSHYYYYYYWWWWLLLSHFHFHMNRNAPVYHHQHSQEKLVLAIKRDGFIWWVSIL